MEAHELFTFAESVTKQQASIVTKGKSDTASILRALSREGVVVHEGVIYALKREDGRYLASIDNPQGVHGFYGAPTKHAAMEWLVGRIDADLLPLCSHCCEHQAGEVVLRGERTYSEYCDECSDGEDRG